MNSKCVSIFDSFNKKVVQNCTLNPSEVLQTEHYWLWARNDKYPESEIDNTKIGKWMVFVPRAGVNTVWNKIKGAIKDGHLWHSKVSTNDHKNSNHAIMVYTRDYTDVEDVIKVLDYLTESGIKPTDTVIRYKTDQQTYAGIYSGGKQKPWIYCSNTIKAEYEMPGPNQNDESSPQKSGGQTLLTQFFSSDRSKHHSEKPQNTSPEK